MARGGHQQAGYGLAGAGANGTVAHSPPQRHTHSLLTMDALKARILEAAPGQVQETICSAQFVPRCVGAAAWSGGSERALGAAAPAPY